MRPKIRSKIYKKRTTRRDKIRIFPVLEKSLFLVLLGFVCIFAYIWLNLGVTKKGYLLSVKEAERAHLEKKNKELKFEVTKLKSLERIEEIARTKLKLVEPKVSKIIWIRR